MHWSVRILKFDKLIYVCLVMIMFGYWGELHGAFLKAPPDSVEYIDHELLLRLKTPADSTSIDSILQPFGCYLISYQPDSLWILAGFDLVYDSVEVVLDSLASCSFLTAAIPNFLLGYGGVPNDPHFTKQYSLHNTGQDLEQDVIGGRPGADIKALQAWNRQRGKPSIKVGVLDSGVPMDGCEIPCCSTGTLGWDDLDDTNTIVLGGNYITNQAGCLPHDLTDGSAGHGTAVLSVLKSEIDNNFGIAGVSDSTLTYIVKPLYAGAHVPAAIQEVIQYGVDIVSASWGYQVTDNPELLWLDTARIQYYEHYVAKPLYDAGILLVACAGNNVGTFANVPVGGSVWFPGAFSQYGTRQGFEDGYSNILNVSGTDR